jgi:hypothetical protein
MKLKKYQLFEATNRVKPTDEIIKIDWNQFDSDSKERDRELFSKKEDLMIMNFFKQFVTLDVRRWVSAKRGNTSFITVFRSSNTFCTIYKTYDDWWFVGSIQHGYFKCDGIDNVMRCLEQMCSKLKKKIK